MEFGISIGGVPEEIAAYEIPEDRPKGCFGDLIFRDLVMKIITPMYFKKFDTLKVNSSKDALQGYREIVEDMLAICVWAEKKVIDGRYRTWDDFKELQKNLLSYYVNINRTSVEKEARMIAIEACQDLRNRLQGFEAKTHSISEDELYSEDDEYAITIQKFKLLGEKL